jgi:drug/metabolite transporter (DMT)-like permease
MNNIVLIIIILLCTILGSFGGYFFKKASLAKSLFDIIINKGLYLGILFYISGAVLNIVVLKYLDYSTVLPLTSITYIWTLFISRIFLYEKITKYKIAGITFILIGACLISGLSI